MLSHRFTARSFAIEWLLLRRLRPLAALSALCLFFTILTRAGASNYQPSLRIELGGPGAVYQAVFTDGGNGIVAISPDRFIRVWNAKTGALVRRILPPNSTKPSSQIYAEAVRGSDDLVACGGYDGPDVRNRYAVSLLDLSTGSTIGTLVGHQNTIEALAFSPDGKLLASGSADDTVRIWNPDAGKRIGSVLNDHKLAVTSVAFSPDGTLLATGGSDQRIVVYSVAETNDEVAVKRLTTISTPGSVECLAWLPGQPSTLVAGGTDHSVTFWDPTAGRQTRSPLIQADNVDCLAVSPDGSSVATGSGETLASDDNVRVWSLATGAVTQQFTRHQSTVLSVAYSPDGAAIASGDAAGAIDIWSPATGQPIGKLVGAGQVSFALAWSPDSRTLAWGYDRPAGPANQAHLDASFDFDTAQFGAQADPATQWQSSYSIAPNRTFEISPDHSALTVIDNGAVTASIDVKSKSYPNDQIVCFASMPKGRILVASVSQLTLYDVPGRSKRIADFNMPGDQISALSVSPDGRYFAAASYDQTVAVYPTTGAGTIAPILQIYATRSGDWIAWLPQAGWFTCSANAAELFQWRVGDQVYPAERYYRKLRDPDKVRQALAGLSVAPATLTSDDIPPSARFVGIDYSGTAGGSPTLKATLEVDGYHDIDPSDVTMLVNGRPLPPTVAQNVQVTAATSDVIEKAIQEWDKAVTVGDKAITLWDKGITLWDKPVTVADKSSVGEYASETGGIPTVSEQFTYQIPLTPGADTVALKAIAYDADQLGSNWTGLLPMSRPSETVSAGRLLVLAVGISNYQNGSKTATTSRLAAGQFSDLEFASADAQSVVTRLKEETPPLYTSVLVYGDGALTDATANLANIEAGFDWLRETSQPSDTVLVFFSGHGFSRGDGRYYFPAYDFDDSSLAAAERTSLSGTEIAAKLGGGLTARNVFLLVDSCHAGALEGARSDDLSFDLDTSGIYMMASSGSSQSSFESADWQHGAFTKALLTCLSDQSLMRPVDPTAPDRSIRYGTLSFAMPDQIASLLKAAGQPQTLEEPVIPLEDLAIDVPVVVAR